MKTRTLYASVSLLCLSGMAWGCSNIDTPIDPEETNPSSDVATQESDLQASDPGSSDGWDVVFYDDFEGNDSIPDTSKWSLCEKGTAGWARYLSGTYAQAYQKDGYLYLRAERQDGEYLTGGIETRGKFDFTYGKVEVRAKIAKIVDGAHTGIWMMPTPPADKWPMSGEIDIMEHIKQQDYVWETIHNYWGDVLGHNDDPKVDTTADINKEDWNTYSVTWTPESITYSINGVDNFTYPNRHLSGDDGFYQWPFDRNFYLILSISLGGEDTWAGPIDNAALPAVFQIDWVKVSQQNTGGAGVPKITAD